MRLSSVGTKNSFGGTAMACNSVLKAVRTSQRSGKTSSRVTGHAAGARRISEADCRSVEVLADQAHQEDGDDVRQHDCKERTGRCHADIEVHQGLLEDQEREVGALVAGAAARG